MTGILLDTRFLYWWMTADEKLGPKAQSLIASMPVAVSAASLWEMVLKNRRGKLPLPTGSLAEAVENEGFRLLPIRAAHVEGVRIHSTGLDDPFDNLLLATATIEGLSFLTRDAGVLRAARLLSLENITTA